MSCCYRWITIPAAAILAGAVTSASATTWYIESDGTGDAPTIQAGVDSAAVGDTVLVAAGPTRVPATRTSSSPARTSSSFRRAGPEPP